jgi:hypothetical protein
MDECGNWLLEARVGYYAITATDSLQLGAAVVQGLISVMVGSAMHAMTSCTVLLWLGVSRQSSCYRT